MRTLTIWSKNTEKASFQRWHTGVFIGVSSVSVPEVRDQGEKPKKQHSAEGNWNEPKALGKALQGTQQGEPIGVAHAIPSTTRGHAKRSEM